MGQLSLALLGTPEAHYGKQLLTFRTRKALALLIYLVLEGGFHSRQALAVLFWPESDQNQGRAMLRTTLAHLRQALPASPESGEGGYLIFEGDALGFNFNADFHLDLHTLEVAMQAIRQKTAEVSPTLPLLDQLQAAVNCYRGDFLTNFSLPDTPDFDDWTGRQQEYWHRQMHPIYDRLSQLQAERGELSAALTTAARWTTHDPLHEAASQRLMQLHVSAGDRVSALQVYEAYRAALSKELHAEPSPEMMALAERIRRGASSASPATSLAASPATPPTAHQLLARLPLVGRTGEFARLIAAYHTARRGDPQGVVLAGEAGIGKTRLADEFLHWAVAEGADVLRGRAFETGGRLPYQPLVEALRRRVDQENAPDDLLSDIWLAELSRLLPELRERYPDLPAPTVDETTAHPRLFEAVTRLFQALAGRAPLVLFLDDIQWADAASYDLLHYVVQHWVEAHAPVLLLLTLRQQEVGSADHNQPNPLSWLTALGRALPLTRLALNPLTADDTVQLVYALTDPEARQQPEAVPQAVGVFSRWLAAETAGQPFYVMETLKMLLDRGLLAPHLNPEGQWLIAFSDTADEVATGLETLGIPPTVQAIIQSQLGRLGQSAGMALTAAAVLGSKFDFEQMCGVAGLSESEGLLALDEILRGGLLRERQATYLFAHDKIREVVYVEAGETRRRIFHRRALAALEARAAPPAILARHALAASLTEQALILSILAGEEATRLFAARDAIEHFTHAFEAARQLSIKPPPKLYRARGKASEMLGEFEAARSDYQAGLAQAQASGDRSGECQAWLDLGFLWQSRDYAQAGDYFQRALTLARALNEPTTLAHSLNRVGNWYVNVEQPFAALPYHQEALAIFETLNDRRGLAETIDLLALANCLCGDLVQSTAYYAQAVELFRELNDRQGLVESLTIRAALGVAWTEVHTGNVAESTREGELALQIARQIGWHSGEAHASVLLGLSLAFEGDYGRALNLAQAGLDITAEIEHREYMIDAHYILGIIHLDLLALPVARQHLEQALALAHEAGSLLWVYRATTFLALVYILQREYAQTESILDAVLGPASRALDSVEWRTQTWARRLVWWARAELALAQGEPHLALQIVERLITFAANISEERPIPCLSKLRGEALAALNRVAEAEAALREAQVAAHTQGASPLLWRIHLALGQLYQAQGHQAEAEREFSGARTIIEALAANIPDALLRGIFLAGAINWAGTIE